MKPAENKAYNVNRRYARLLRVCRDVMGNNEKNEIEKIAYINSFDYVFWMYSGNHEMLFRIR